MEDCEPSDRDLVKELARARTRIAYLETQLKAQDADVSNVQNGSLVWFRNLVETIPDLVWLKDVDGVFLGCNPMFERFVGFTADQIIGKTDYDLVDKELADFFRKNDKKALNADRPSRNEEWLTFADGSHQGLFETIKTPMRDSSGYVIGVLGIARDITEYKRIEEALERRLIALTQPLDDVEDIGFEELFNIDDIQRLQDKFSRATQVASLITKPDGTPITKPSNFCRLCQDFIRKSEKGLANCYKSDIFLGRMSSDGPTVKLCMSGGLWDAGAAISVGGRHIASWLVGQVRNSAQSEFAMRDYAQQIGVNEDEFIKAFREVPAMSRGQFEKVAEALYTLANQLSAMAYQNIQQARFISERKRIEEQLIEMKDKAEAANTAKSEFLANMSHEIRTPLNGVLGMLQLLRNTTLTPKQHEYVSAALNSSERLTRLLSDILDLSRIEAGKMQIIYAAFNLNACMKSIEDLFIYPAKEKNIALTWKQESSIPNSLLGDEIRLRQILFNIVGNAVKFTEKGGVHIEVLRLPSLDEQTIRLLFIVTDTGIGITDDVLKNIFEPFVQGEGSYSRLFQGAGLGLAIIRKLVRLMNAELAIDNTGPGTTMYLTIPFSKAMQDVVAGQDKDSPGPYHFEKKPNILFAEDDVVTLIAASETLANFGYTVDTAQNGAEVLELLQQKEYDLILLDIQMPIMDGVAVTRTIRHSPEFSNKAHIPIIAMTAYAMAGDRNKFIEAGMDEYISKPVDMKKLMKLIDRVMEKRMPTI